MDQVEWKFTHTGVSCNSAAKTILSSLAFLLPLLSVYLLRAF